MVYNDRYLDGAGDGAGRFTDVCGGFYRPASYHDRLANERIYWLLSYGNDIQAVFAAMRKRVRGAIWIR